MTSDESISQNVPQVDGESEKMKQLLLEKRAAIEQKNNIINSKEIGDTNQQNMSREKIVAELFKMMQAKGVNLDDPESIKEFLLTLEETNPDLKELFEFAFTGLTEDDGQNVALTDKEIPMMPIGR